MDDLADHVRSIIQSLFLEPHPEGGYYRETYTCETSYPSGGIQSTVRRHLSSAIYFLLPGGSVSKLHRIDADELWHHYDGDEITIVEFVTGSPAKYTVLGKALHRGEVPQHLVPAGSWFGAYAPEGFGYSLMGCTVSPAFIKGELEFGSASSLIAEFPSDIVTIRKLT